MLFERICKASRHAANVLIFERLSLFGCVVCKRLLNLRIFFAFCRGQNGIAHWIFCGARKGVTLPGTGGVELGTRWGRGTWRNASLRSQGAATARAKMSQNTISPGMRRSGTDAGRATRSGNRPGFGVNVADHVSASVEHQ